MAKDQSEYFKEKHVWSRTKDSILSCYLTPFFQKVMTASPNGIVYVDGFSGAGKFESGEPGSPLIAIQKFREAHRKSRPKPPVQFVFAEAKRSARDCGGDPGPRKGYTEDRMYSTEQRKLAIETCIKLDLSAADIVAQLSPLREVARPAGWPAARSMVPGEGE